MARRSSVVPVATKVDPPWESKVHRCQSCGVGLHGKARRQYICSWCKGDPDHGCDNYFNDMIDDPSAPWFGMPRADVVAMLLADKR